MRANLGLDAHDDGPGELVENGEQIVCRPIPVVGSNLFFVFCAVQTRRDPQAVSTPSKTS
ncbi:hypothetical protein [Ruegeria lacuscaerulensis]|uniref:hypothetical protein n=1 Tax=Ruegeria lacuscaerulensis TaxID=55218 RepID=UPI00147AD5B5|nr:hypothetical protein [Ruegeria lacuscaerulensis]